MWQPIRPASRHNTLADSFEWYMQEAQTLFDRALWRGGVWRAFALLRGEVTQLSVCHAPVITHERIQIVDIARIQGTLDRVHDFDARFYPLHREMGDRWVKVAMRMLAGAPLPAIRLIDHGGIYYVIDGHHRVSVARLLGAHQVDAVVANGR